MFSNFSVEQSLMMAKSHAKKGELAEAEKLYQKIFQDISNNIRSQRELLDLESSIQNNCTQSPPQELVDQLVNLYNQGKIEDVIIQAESLVDEYPGAYIVWNILGTSRTQIGKLDKAIDAYNKAISLKPDHADFYFNMGIALKETGKIPRGSEVI